MAVLTPAQDLRQSSRERRSREHVVHAGRARGIDEIGLHVRDKAHGRNRRERWITLHRRDSAERIGPWIVQIENDQSR